VSDEHLELLWGDVGFGALALLAARECDLFHRVLDENLILHNC
jgi:hypothetical protein